MSRDEILATSSTLILGGSDTTATLLAGTVFYLLQNPQANQKLVAEIRSGFADEAEINITTVAKLPYLLATLEEAMRMYPPVALGSPRVVGDEGAVLGGYHVPPKVRKLIYGRKELVEVNKHLDSCSQQPVRVCPLFEELPQPRVLRP
jgi:cytochrome P450